MQTVNKGTHYSIFFFKFEYANPRDANKGDKDNKVKPYMVCQIKKGGSIQTNRVSSKVPYLSLRSSRSSLRSSALTETGQGCHLEAGAGDFPQATMNVAPAAFKGKKKVKQNQKKPLAV